MTRKGRVVVAAFTFVVLVAAAAYVWTTLLRDGSPSPAPTVNSAAYDLYLRGRVNVGSENRDNNETAIKLLQQAIAVDPNFAPAYAQLARAYNIKAFYYAPGGERKQLTVDAEVAVEKALRLEPNLAEAYLSRGLLLWTQTKRFPHEQAAQAYKRAIGLNPKLDEAHHQLAMVYLHVGLLEKAWREVDAALAVNPANTMARFRYGVIDLYRGRYEDALAIFTSTPAEVNPALVSFQQAHTLLQLGRTDAASEIVNEYLKTHTSDEGGNVTSVKAMLLAKAGKAADAEQAIQSAVAVGKSFGHFHHTEYNIASAYALLNKQDEAIKWLQLAADDGFPCYPLFAQDANLSNLRKNERFVAFLAEIKARTERYDATF